MLICTDVASRGLDFKNVDWILQYDLSSQIKEYINRVGRTARIASAGQALSFVMPNEMGYVEHLRKKYQVELNEKSRFAMVKSFENEFHERNSDLKFKFRRLVNIEDVDEQQESLHAVRQHLTALMVDEETGLKNMAQIARSSSTRAYAGHSSEMRHIFDLKQLNLTEFARSFGLYKQLYISAKREKEKQKESERQDLNKALLKGRAAGKDPKPSVVNVESHEDDLDEAVKKNQTLYSRRLQKSKIKDLERDLRQLNRGDRIGQNRIQEELKKAKQDVFTDERKIEQRKMGFKRAKTDIKKTQLSEFM